ncbi:UNVERIFIED_CONTAM: hypothetical protein FKN15_051532 [Acipenser sinensis]
MCLACRKWGHFMVNCSHLQEEEEKEHQFPARDGESPLSPAREGESHPSPVTKGELHQSPLTEGEPHQSPVTEGEPLQSPVTEGEPHQSPEIGDYLLLPPPPLEGDYLQL